MKRQTLATDLKKLIGGDESFKRIPPPRREAARNALELGKSLARSAAEEAAKAALKNLGYGLRFYGGRCHAIEGLKDGETYYQSAFPGGEDSWQKTLEAILEVGRSPQNT